MTHFDKIEKAVQRGFRQKDIWTCGPASINVILYSMGLEAKPEIAWKDAYFSKWVPVDNFPIRGMALHELQFTSEMILGTQFEFILRRAYPENYEHFLNDIEKVKNHSDAAMILNFRQDDLVDQAPGNQGNPHYSPLAGVQINQQTNETEILIADVDPEVKEPFWVNSKKAFKSMSEINPAFNIPRGWLLMRRRNKQ